MEMASKKSHLQIGTRGERQIIGADKGLRLSKIADNALTLIVNTGTENW